MKVHFLCDLICVKHMQVLPPLEILRDAFEFDGLRWKRSTGDGDRR